MSDKTDFWAEYFKRPYPQASMTRTSKRLFKKGPKTEIFGNI